MTSTDVIRSIIERRAALSDEWQAGVEKCWEELTEALTEDFEVTRRFLLVDCTAEEASWVSEVYDEIVFKTQSQEYIDLLSKSIERFPEEAREHRMSDNLGLAVRTMLTDN